MRHFYIIYVLISILFFSCKSNNQESNLKNKKSNLSYVNLQIGTQPLVPCSITLSMRDSVLIVNPGFRLYTLPDDNLTTFVKPTFIYQKFNKSDFSKVLKISNDLLLDRNAKGIQGCNIDSLVNNYKYAYVSINYVFNNDSIRTLEIMDDFSMHEKEFILILTNEILEGLADADTVNNYYFNELKSYIDKTKTLVNDSIKE